MNICCMYIYMTVRLCVCVCVHVCVKECCAVVCRMCVKSLVDLAAFETITDDCLHVFNLCNVLEHIFSHRLQGAWSCSTSPHHPHTLTRLTTLTSSHPHKTHHPHKIHCPHTLTTLTTCTIHSHPHLSHHPHHSHNLHYTLTPSHPHHRHHPHHPHSSPSAIWPGRANQLLGGDPAPRPLFLPHQRGRHGGRAHRSRTGEERSAVSLSIIVCGLTPPLLYSCVCM